uniref:Global nitrogen transcriptional regulator n=1 Tax=Taenioma perpusillum TaxID=210852 RepID=A0A1Z1MS49_9FLOR|nr:global nitrogen transcriptional regulator [Taenioma perpusillum]ARW68591.1 global nitrogen transcriptional regulator [Taenioma perpusillum]
MKWIYNLSKTNINYYIYKLNINDEILYNNNEARYLYILKGTIAMFKCFNNNKTFFSTLLNNNQIICLNMTTSIYSSDEYYYKFIAFSTTYLISFPYKIYSNLLFIHNLNPYIIRSQNLIIKRYEITNYIFQQKYMKNRIISIILFLVIEFGIFYNKYICIPFKLGQNKLALLTGINKTTVNKIIRQLYKKKVIYYKNKSICLNNISNLSSIYFY